MQRFLERISAGLPKKTIGGECFTTRGPLMLRYAMLRTRRFNVYLHNFLRSDADRHCHDHPWSFLSVILTGGYVEHTPSISRRFHPGSVRFRPAEWLHWVEVSKPMWTLVVVFPKRREWGFLTERGWRRWTDYEAEFPEACDD